MEELSSRKVWLKLFCIFATIMKLCFYQHKTIVQHILGVNYSLNILILHISDVLSLSLTSDFPLHFMRSVIMIVILMTIFLEHFYRYLGQFFFDFQSKTWNFACMELLWGTIEFCSSWGHTASMEAKTNVSHFWHLLSVKHANSTLMEDCHQDFDLI